MAYTAFPELAEHLSKPENARKYRPSAEERKRRMNDLMAGPWGDSIRAWQQFDAGDAGPALALERQGMLFPRFA